MRFVYKPIATVGLLAWEPARNFRYRVGFVTNSGLKAYPALDYPLPIRFA
jgi:hypothetical protein